MTKVKMAVKLGSPNPYTHEFGDSKLSFSLTADRDTILRVEQAIKTALAEAAKVSPPQHRLGEE